MNNNNNTLSIKTIISNSILLCVILFTSGCVSNVNIKSNSTPDFSSKIKKLNIVTYLHNTGNQVFIKNMRESLNKLSRSHGVEVLVQSINGLEISQELEDIVKKANQYSDYLLTIKSVGGDKVNGKISKLKFNLAIIKKAVKQKPQAIIWRANIDLALANFIDDKETSLTLSQAIYKRLQDDKVI